ncbi:hypothetical protein BDV93DRAFT_508519 [Ceratobasidium sp. AG-I]|nr:hypothetical protein BDV93DRAFT_508519 [Ceratobasidium sp. AG-I]
MVLVVTLRTTTPSRHSRATVSCPRTLPTPWDLAEIFALAVCGLYLTFYNHPHGVILGGNYFKNTFDISLGGALDVIIYLQFSIISQAPMFVARPHALLMEFLSTLSMPSRLLGLR